MKLCISLDCVRSIAKVGQKIKTEIEAYQDHIQKKERRVVKNPFTGINITDFQQTKFFRIINLLIKVSIIQTFQIKVVQNQFLS